MKRTKRVKKCSYHILGTYFTEDINLRLFAGEEDLEDKKDEFALQYFGFCPICGTEITDIIKEKQLEGLQ